jgi:hypothetical protein
VSWPASPEWLLELQGRFGALLRTPLERSSGELRAETAGYDAALTEAVLPTETSSAAERLAVYHRQYWFRLFTVLQGLYPLTARLLGYWRFNELAARHLVERPPSGFDIDTIGDGFDRGLARDLRDEDAVVEAAHVDAAFHRVSRAPQSEPFRPSAEDAARLGSSRLQLAGNVALLSEHWSLAQLRASLTVQPGDKRLELGPALPTTQYWLLKRHQNQLGLVALEAPEAELFRLVQQHPLQQALGMLEAAAPDGERATLPARAQGWLARSVQLGAWAGLRKD